MDGYFAGSAKFPDGGVLCAVIDSGLCGAGLRRRSRLQRGTRDGLSERSRRAGDVDGHRAVRRPVQGRCGILPVDGIAEPRLCRAEAGSERTPPSRPRIANAHDRRNAD